MKVLCQPFRKSFFAVIIALTSCVVVFSQSDPVIQKFNEAVSYFNEENYNHALPLFESILDDYPDTVAASYYIGVCLLNLDVQLERSVELLKFSRTNNFCTEAHFFLFLAYLKNQQYPEAEISLMNFSNLASKREKRKFKLDYWQKELAKEREITKANTDTADVLGMIPEHPKGEEPGVNKGKVDEPEEETEYDLILQQALMVQLICDSLKSELTNLKIEFRAEENEKQREILYSGIIRTGNKLRHYQENADYLFAKAEVEKSGVKVKEEVKPETTPVNENEHIYLEKEIGDIRLYAFRSKTPQAEEILEKRETLPVKIPNFEIFQQSPYSEKNPIPLDERLPDGLVYRIQLGAYSKALPANAFGGLSPIFGEYYQERQLTKYYVGLFYSSVDAKNALQKVKEYGYPDAFLVPYYNQGKISIQSAREKEFGEKK